MNKIWIYIFLVLTTFFILRYGIVRQAVYGDGIYYWVYTRSLYFDKDIRLGNDLNHNFSPQENNREYIQPKKTVQNHFFQNQYPPLAPLLWLPFFGIADGITVINKSFGINMVRNGYADIYQIIVGLGNILFVVIGLHFLYMLLSKYFQKQTVITTIIVYLFSTNLVYYGSLDILNSHPTSFMLSAIYVYYWITTREKSDVKMWLMLGFLLGLITATRTQDILLGFLLISDVFINNHIRQFSFSIVTKYFSVLLGFILGFLPQLFVWIHLFGTFWHSPYADNGAFNLLNPRLLEVFVNVKTGLLYFNPVFLLSIIGILLFNKIHKHLRGIIIMQIVICLYLIASWSGWHQGESYGYRMLLSLSPLFVLGIGNLIDRYAKKFHTVTFTLILLLFVLYNFGLIVLFQVYIQENSYILGENTEERLLQKITSWL